MARGARVPPTPTVWRARPRCLSCGLCCVGTEMVLTPSDLRRLELLGFRREEFAVYDGRFYRLRNVGGRCFFHRGGRCAVYEHRPIGCSMYPIVVDPETLEVRVDGYCPLAGETRPEELERARRIAPRIIGELRRGYAPRERL